jgi:hypothetical protein
MPSVFDSVLSGTEGTAAAAAAGAATATTAGFDVLDLVDSGVSIVGFGRMVQVYNSKQLPKRITIYGSDFR